MSRKLEAQGVARDMFLCNALTLKEFQSVHAKRSTPVKAAELLLNIVMNQSDGVYSCFLDALKSTNNRHVFEFIVSASCKGTNRDLLLTYFITKLEMRSVERGICPIATSIMNELFQ